MRRLALSLMATCGFAVLAACSGGTGFSGSGAATNPNVTGIYFTNGSGQVNDFFVAPSGNSPIAVNAVAYNGTGAVQNVIPGVSFTWAATYAPAGTTYTRGSIPSGNGTCGTAAQLPAVASLLQSGPGGQPFGPAAAPLYSGLYSQLADRNNPVGSAPNYTANPPAYVTQTDHIWVGPPLALTGTGTETSTPVAPATGSSNYCLRLVATAVGSGVQGSVLVVVTNTQ